MPCVVMEGVGQVRMDMFGLSMMQSIKMYVLEGTIMGIGQDWVEEEQETEEYGEPVGALRGVGEGIP